MSLDNIQLQPIVLQELFKKSLVGSKFEQINYNSSDEQKIAFLGNNERKIIILVNNTNHSFLPDEELSFLIEILRACKLDVKDVAIVNYAKQSSVNYQLLLEYFSANKIFAFGISQDEIELPLQFPPYQVQVYNDVTYLHTPSLQLLKNNKEEKAKLWVSLQKIFFN